MFELNTPLRRCHVAAHFQISRPPRKSATHPNSAFFPVFTCTANPFRLAQCYQLPHIRMLAAFPLHRRLQFVLVVSARTCYNNSSWSKIARFRKNAPVEVCRKEDDVPTCEYWVNTPRKVLSYRVLVLFERSN
ncbi:hypothetical protein Zmor_009517 [Zophobas morio]|uniref:Uncharacterized protein n=1 Tax=Zophobas morio TaxID=2755281 RepID=A0AA38IH21_9CUCU|nr:hypothetical protein Zmor_009517 [Zophobas morio]